MQEFKYQAISADGHLTDGTLRAEDKPAAAKQIEAGKLIIIELEPLAQSGANFELSSLFKRSIPRGDITTLINDLATLAKSRLRIDEALELMLQELELGRVRLLLEDLLQRLKGGESLSVAMNAHPDVFDKLEVEMVRLAEASGELGETLEQISGDRELKAKVENQISSSLRYPVFLLIAAFAILVFFLVYVIPQFEIVLVEAQGDDGALGTVFAVSRFLNSNSDLIMLSLLALLITVWIASKTPSFQTFFRSVLLRMPIAGNIVKTYRNARICNLIAQTQKAGVELPVALSVIGPAVDGPAETKISSDAVSGLRQGKKLADVLKEHGDLQDLALRMIRVGEESSQVAALAARAGALYEARAQRQLARLIGIIGPATLVLISIVIGGLIVTIMTSLLSINDIISV